MTEITSRPNVSVGDPDALRHEIIRCEVGSTAHGMGTGSDDLDLMGVYVEAPEQLLGLQPSAGHFISRTQPEGVRSGPGDVDLTLYSLRKYVRLAAAGNPTVLILLYAPTYRLLTPTGERLRGLRDAIVSRQAGDRFLGYLDGQRERMEGRGRQSRVPNRPELTERFGYDVKYAGHAVRLGMQGIELLTTGALSLPLPPPSLEVCRAVRTGQTSYAEALTIVNELHDELAALVTSNSSALRPDPDWTTINRELVAMHLDYHGLSSATLEPGG